MGWTGPSRSTRTRCTSALPCAAEFICAFSLASSLGVVSTAVMGVSLSASSIGGISEWAQQDGNVVMVFVVVHQEGHGDLRVEGADLLRQEIVGYSKADPIVARR